MIWSTVKTAVCSRIATLTAATTTRGWLYQPICRLSYLLCARNRPSICYLTLVLEMAIHAESYVSLSDQALVPMGVITVGLDGFPITGYLVTR